MKSEIKWEKVGRSKMYQAKYTENKLDLFGGGGPKIKVARNGLKHILVLEFSKLDNIGFFCNCPGTIQ